MSINKNFFLQNKIALFNFAFIKSELIDKVFFEIVHPLDIKQVKDQLIYHDMNYCMH